MATLNTKALFFTTSPRTPAKIIPEIKLLNDKFNNRPWNKVSQEQFIDELAASSFFAGVGSPSDKAFSARDRINRAPKSLGFVDLKPAGHAFVFGKRPQEIFLRQLLKFQLPSPFHQENKRIQGSFCIRPYLEILRLIRDLEYLTFDELKVFGIQMTDYHRFEDIKAMILRFRQNKENHRGTYKRFVDDAWTNTILEIHSDRIACGKTKTRETRDASLKNFVKTQKSNLRDYTDACFRYLRYTGLVSIAHRSRTMSIFDSKAVEVDYILSTVDRNPVFIDDAERYKAHLFSAGTPLLYVDNKDNIIDSIMRISAYTKRDLLNMNIEQLKDLRDNIIAQHKESVIHEQVSEIKSYALYSEIIDTFNEIVSDEYYDAPLMFEYNTWRAMTMLDGGEIKGNFKFDDIGQPLSTAAGNMPDIECDYTDYALSVEVTLQRGQRQYESEGEPVARHYGQLKKRSGKETYCLFIAPSINMATLAHFYGLNHVPIALYGGKSKIIPLELDQFMQLVENSYNYKHQPVAADVRHFLDTVIEQGEIAADENDWRERIQNCVDTWLVA